MLNNIAATLGGGVVAPLTDYESIATTTVGAGGAADVTFSSIPSTYTHLQFRISAMSSNTNSDFWSVFADYNSDSNSANYRYHRLTGDGTSVLSFAGQEAGNRIAYLLTNYSGNGYNSIVLDILDYANTNKNKTTRALSGVEGSSRQFVELNSGLYVSTSALSTVKFRIQSGGGNFLQYSTFALYGIK